jgi:hypothetical protein
MINLLWTLRFVTLHGEPRGKLNRGDLEVTVPGCSASSSMRGARLRAVITSSARTAVCRRAADRPTGVAGVRAPAPHELKESKDQRWAK